MFFLCPPCALRPTDPVAQLPPSPKSLFVSLVSSSTVGAVHCDPIPRSFTPESATARAALVHFRVFGSARRGPIFRHNSVPFISDIRNASDSIESTGTDLT